MNQNLRLKRTVIIDNKLEDRERLNAISYRVNHSLKHSTLHSDLKDALERNGIKIEHFPHVNFKLRDYQEKSDFVDTRAYIYETKKCHSNSMTVDGTSHVVQISIGSDNAIGWHNGDSDFTAKVYVDSDKDISAVIICLLDDIRLDIMLFYLFSLDNFYQTPDERRAFSRVKVRFSRDNLQRSNFYGDIDDPEYISIASFFHTEKGFLWDDFIRCWLELKEYVINLNARTICPERDYQQFKLHKKYRQISQKKLQILLQELPSGDYSLVRTERCPRESKACKELMNRFGMEKWKTGKMKIVPICSKYTWTRMEPNVSLFDFHWE